MKRLLLPITVLAATLAGCHATHRGGAKIHDAAPTRAQESQQEKDQAADLTKAMEADLARTQQAVQSTAGELDFSSMAMTLGTAGVASLTSGSAGVATGTAAPEVGPREVTAEVEKIDRDHDEVVFYVKTTVQEIELQAGRELVVPFDQLPEITGADTADDAVDTLPEGTDVRAWVSGVGDAMKITRIAPEKG